MDLHLPRSPKNRMTGLSGRLKKKTMNLKRFINETKEYVRTHLDIPGRADTHTVPMVHPDDLWGYLRSLHVRFRHPRYLRMLRRLESRGLILAVSERSLVFEPTFSF